MNTQKLILAGGSGFLGRMLSSHFLAQGWDVCVLTRRPEISSSTDARAQASCGASSVTRLWDGRTFGDWAAELEGATALINLAGRSVDCRYHARNRHLIMDSRVESTRLLGQAVARCTRPPQVWLNASTATIYKHSLDRPMTESGELGATAEAKDAFSIDVAQAWEQCFHSAEAPKTRKVTLRIAMVLGREAGVFPALHRLARLGLGGPMGSGRQYVSWIHKTDFCRAVEWLIHKDDVRGIVNVAAPTPLPNQQMMSIMRQACSIPFGLSATLWMLELGAFFLRTETELIIKSRRVVPGRLLEAGFRFRFREMEEAVKDLLACP